MKNFSFSLMLLLGLAMITMSSCITCNYESNSDSDTTEEQIDDLDEKIEDIIDNSSDELKEGISQGLQGLKEALNEIEQNLENDENGEKKELTNFRDLKKMMPSKVDGIDQTSNTGETAGAFGFKFSKAVAKYKEDDRWVEIEIIDAAGAGLAVLGDAVWNNVEVDKETDHGYERTTEFEGHRAYEKWDSRRNMAQFSVFVDKRFMVMAKAKNVKMSDLKRSIRKMGFRKFRQLI